MSLSKQTITKLRKVMNYIKEEPRRLDMNNWMIKANLKNPAAVESLMDNLHMGGNTKDDLPPCGTAACLAGTALLTLLPKTKQKEFVNIDPDVKGYMTFNWGTSTKAAELLGLSEDQKCFLFYPDSWPESYSTAYNEAQDESTAKRRAKMRYKVTNALVEAFIAADGNIYDIPDYNG